MAKPFRPYKTKVRRITIDLDTFIENYRIRRGKERGEDIDYPTATWLLSWDLKRMGPDAMFEQRKPKKWKWLEI